MTSRGRLVAALLVVAGAVLLVSFGVSIWTDDDTEPHTSPGEEPMPEPYSADIITATLYDGPLDNRTVVNYTDLTPAQRAEFDDARRGRVEKEDLALSEYVSEEYVIARGSGYYELELLGIVVS